MNARADPGTAPLVLRDDDNGVAHLTLNRPKRHNVLSLAMIEALIEAFERIAEDDAVRVVVLAAAGRNFCAGHDLGEMRQHASAAAQQKLFRTCNRLMRKMVGLPQPVIARVQGAAAAAGCQLVSMCDLAIAADDSRFAVSGVKVGLFCATPAVGLSRNIGRKAAFEMLVTGDFIDAGEALRLGLLNRVVPLHGLDGAITELTGAIVARSPAAIRMGKQLFYRQSEMGLDAAYQLAAETMACNMLEQDTLDRIDAFLQPERK